jgi:hypothetical protein
MNAIRKLDVRNSEIDLARVIYEAFLVNRPQGAFVALFRLGHGIDGTAGLGTGPQRPRDLLDDLNAVLGRERIPVADVPALLRGLAPHWGPYRSLTGVQLRTVLRDDHGIRVPSTGNTWPLDPATVRACIAERGARQAGAEAGQGGVRSSTTSPDPRIPAFRETETGNLIWGWT